jgi:hypothetical protein
VAGIGFGIYKLRNDNPDQTLRKQKKDIKLVSGNMEIIPYIVQKKRGHYRRRKNARGLEI